VLLFFLSDDSVEIYGPCRS